MYSVRISAALAVALASSLSFAVGRARATTEQVAPVATITDPDGQIGDQFGVSVSLSADGTSALIGAGSAAVDGVVGAGKAYIYTQADGVWSPTPVVTFLDPTLQYSDHFGVTALSADGSVAVISSGSPAGADDFVYVYDRNDGVWSTIPVATFADPDSSDGGVYGDGFGCPALSTGGSTLLVGAPFATVNGVADAGKAYIFAKIGRVWSSMPVAIFTDPDDTKGDTFGCGTLSADGTVAMIGTWHMFGPGRTYVFTRTGNSWNTVPAAAFAAGQTTALAYPKLALSGAGDIALLGIKSFESYSGVAYIYAAANGIWPSSPTTTLNIPALGGSQYFGSNVGLSSDGMIAAVASGTTVDGITSATVYMYTQASGSWVTEPSAALLDPLSGQSQYEYDDNFGYAMALSANGKTVLVGNPQFIEPAGGPVVCTGPSCPPKTQIGGPGVVYAYSAPVGGWPAPTQPSPPSPASPTGSSGGGTLGWFSDGVLLLLLIVMRVFAKPQRV